MTLALLTLLHALNSLVWGSVAVRLTPAFYRVCTQRWRHRGRGNDPIWTLLWGISVNRLWLALHGSTFGEATRPDLALDLLVAWYVFAIGLGCIAHFIRSWYGLGAPLVSEAAS